MFEKPQIRKQARCLLIVYVTVLSLVLNACSFFGGLPSQDEQSQKLVETMEKGYAPARGFMIDSSREVWMHNGTELEVVMTMPTAPGSYPLIIYLPGLGEDAKAGLLWRETWAKAGYAVFSLQSVAVGQALKELRRTGTGGQDDESAELMDDNDLEAPKP